MAQRIGKFDNDTAAAIHQLSLEGCDSETGSVQWLGWAGLVLLTHTECEALAACGDPESGLLRERLAQTPVIEGDLSYLGRYSECDPSVIAAAIITEDSQGFVSVELFGSDTAARAEFAHYENRDSQNEETNQGEN